MNIMVIGGAGFIGSHVTEAYKKAGHRVSVLDDLSTGKRKNLPEGVDLHLGDLNDAAFVLRTLQAVQPEVINHHAAQISVVVSTQEPQRDAQTNIIGTINLLEAARAVPSVKRIIYGSTGGAMYGQPDQLPCTEETPAFPCSPYGLSKHTAERYVWLYASQGAFKAVVLRYSNVYGPRQDPHGEAGVNAIFAERMLEGREVTIFGDGSQFRDYVYVGDVAAANLAALEKGEGEAFNISTGTPTATQEVFEILSRETGYQKKPLRKPDRPGEIPGIYLSPEKAARMLGWRPSHTFAEGIKKTVAWYRS